MIEEICRMCHYASWQLVSSVYVFLVQDVVVSTCGSLFGMCLLDYCWTVWVNLSSSKDFVELLTTELHISFSIQTFQITNQHWPTGLQCDRRSYMIDVEISGRTHPGQTHTHILLWLGEQRPEPAGSHKSSEKEEYQTGSFFCRGLEKHGRHHTAGALLKRIRDQLPLRFHSHVRSVTFMTDVKLNNLISH